MHVQRPKFQFFETADGSPSLELQYSPELKESMHHSKGAFSESLYIYGKALELGFGQFTKPRILSVGLGLAYNEFLTAAYAIKAGCSADDIVLSSFETEEILIESLLAFLHGAPLDEKYKQAYSWIVEACSRHFRIASDSLLESLKDLRVRQKWKIHGAFLPTTMESSDQWNILLYDAFSSKTSPTLWSEAELCAFLQNNCEESCVFSTYASTGTLKRLLKSKGFKDHKRAGFGGKRECTLALR